MKLFFETFRAAMLVLGVLPIINFIASEEISRSCLEIVTTGLYLPSMTRFSTVEQGLAML